MIRFLALSLAVLITPVVAKADFVIDDFTQLLPPAPLPAPQQLQKFFGPAVSLSAPTLTMSPGVTRSLAATSPDSGFLNVTLGSGQINAVASAGSTITISYNFANPLDLHSVGVSANPVRLGNFSVVSGVWALTTTYTSALAGGSASFADVTLVSGADVYFDGRTLGNGLLASNVSEIDLVFTSIANNGANPAAFIMAGEFVATPEPASLALTGLAVSSLGGMGYIRRRRNAEPALAT